MKSHGLLLCLTIVSLLTVKIIPQTTYIVKVSNYQFTPKNVNISPGDTVKWEWVNGTHTTTSDSTTGPDSWNSPINQQNPTFSFVFKYPGVHSYYCIFHKSLGMIGTITVSQPTAVLSAPQIPGSFNLEQNYPNPFNPQTEIKYSIPRTVHVKLSVYDITGKKIKDLVNTTESAGSYIVKFNADSYASGIYFYKITAGPYTDVKKMILLK